MAFSLPPAARARVWRICAEARCAPNGRFSSFCSRAVILNYVACTGEGERGRIVVFCRTPLSRGVRTTGQLYAVGIMG